MSIETRRLRRTLKRRLKVPFRLLPPNAPDELKAAVAARVFADFKRDFGLSDETMAEITR